MEAQERLFRLALEAVHVQMQFEVARGWKLVVGARRGDEEWPDAERREYTHLSTPELVDVLECELGRLFAL